MADVTISQLNSRAPTSDDVFPFSTAVSPSTYKASLAQIKTSLGLASVASTGNYNDLSNKPSIPPALGFTPVQQGGGVNQFGNKLYLGWSGNNLLLQVDATNFGSTWPINIGGTASNGIKAWANFDGNGGVGTNQSIRASFNISSIYKEGDGLYRVYFASPLADSNYVVSGVNGGQSASYLFNLYGDGPVQTPFEFRCCVVYPGNRLFSTNNIQFMVIR